MEDSPATQLIAVCLQHPEFNQLINDIRDFDWKIVNKLRASDLDRIASIGFKFTTKGLESRRQEFKSFLINTPACMASDFEMIICKLQIYSRLITPKRTAISARPKEVPKKKPIVVSASSDSDSESSETPSEPETEGEGEEEDSGRRVWY
jgi:hypothetical protein